MNALGDLSESAGFAPASVTGSGTPADPFVVTFGGELTGIPVPAMTADATQLTGSLNTITTSYNADGQITSIGDNFSHYAYTYTGQGNVASVDNAGTPGVPDVLLTSQYDTAGNRASLAATIAGTADFLNTYSYNTLSQLSMIDQQGQTGGNAVAPKSIYLGYNAVGDVNVIYRQNSVTIGPPTQADPADTALSYNALGLLTGISQTHAGASLDNLSYTYDPLARVSTFASIDGTASYGYDPTSQLTSATYTTAPGGTEPPNLSLAFDPNGNRTSVNGTSTTIGADKHLTSDGTFNFTYDPTGNLSTRVRISNASANDYKTVYLWDYRDRLTDVAFYNNSGVLTQHVHYVYDVWDHLIERDLDPTGGGAYTQIVQYVWDSPLPPGQGQGEGGIVLAFNGSQQLTARYLNDPNTSAYDQYFTTLAEEDVSSVTSPGTVTYDLLDPQGSVHDIVDANGNKVDHMVYGPFGQTVLETSTSVSHVGGWQGGYTDDATPAEGTIPLNLAEGTPTEAAPMTKLYHKGELKNGLVDPARTLSTGTDAECVAGLNRSGRVHTFEVPKDVLDTWKSPGARTRGGRFGP